MAESYTLEAAFTDAASACATTTIGTCKVNPCYVSPSSASERTLPNAGTVSLLGATMSSVVIDPQTDGTYTTQTVAGQVPWTTGGAAVTLEWAHFPGNAAQPGGAATLASPPYVTLTVGSAFADTYSTLVRTQDLAFSWTTDSPPAPLDQVSVYFSTGSIQVGCNFSASSGVGVVPAGVLQFLDAGQGTFDVHSKQSTNQHVTGTDGAAWDLSFNVDATARTSYGLARGTLTVQ